METIVGWLLTWAVRPPRGLQRFPRLSPAGLVTILTLILAGCGYWLGTQEIAAAVEWKSVVDAHLASVPAAVAQQEAINLRLTLQLENLRSEQLEHRAYLRALVLHANLDADALARRAAWEASQPTPEPRPIMKAATSAPVPTPAPPRQGIPLARSGPEEFIP